jgi:hypothetical protein
VLSEELAVVLDRADPFMHLIDVKRGVYSYALTPGPEDSTDALNVYRIAPSPSDAHEFLGYDLIGGTLNLWRIGGAERPLTLVSRITLQSIETVDAPIWHPDGRISVELTRVNALRAWVGRDGTLSEPTGVALTAGQPSWIPDEAWRRAMAGNTCASPDRKRIARVFQHTARLLVLDSAGNSVPGARDESFFSPSFDVRDVTGEVVFAGNSNTSRLAYRACSATRDRIYALFSGRLPRLSGANSEPVAGQVHVYDWRGRMLGGFRLQRDAIGLGVTPSGRMLLALEGGAYDPGITAYGIARRYR